MKKRIMCFGDSNTWGYIPADGGRYPEEVRYTGVLSETLGEDYIVVEEGLNGRAIAMRDLIEPERCALDHIMPILLSHLPLDYITIMLGTNDTKLHYNLTAELIGYALDELIVKIKNILRRYESDAKIIIIAPYPIKETEDAMFDDGSARKSRELGCVYKNWADLHGCAFLDCATLPMATGADGIHLTPESHTALGEALAKVIREEM